SCGTCARWTTSWRQAASGPSRASAGTSRPSPSTPGGWAYEWDSRSGSEARVPSLGSARAIGARDPIDDLARPGESTALAQRSLSHLASRARVAQLMLDALEFQVRRAQLLLDLSALPAQTPDAEPAVIPEQTGVGQPQREQGPDPAQASQLGDRRTAVAGEAIALDARSDVSHDLRVLSGRGSFATSIAPGATPSRRLV